MRDTYRQLKKKSKKKPGDSKTMAFVFENAIAQLCRSVTDCVPVCDKDSESGDITPKLLEMLEEMEMQLDGGKSLLEEMERQTGQDYSSGKQALERIIHYAETFRGSSLDSDEIEGSDDYPDSEIRLDSQTTKTSEVPNANHVATQDVKGGSKHSNATAATCAETEEDEKGLQTESAAKTEEDSSSNVETNESRLEDGVDKTLVEEVKKISNVPKSSTEEEDVKGDVITETGVCDATTVVSEVTNDTPRPPPSADATELEERFWKHGVDGAAGQLLHFLIQENGFDVAQNLMEQITRESDLNTVLDEVERRLHELSSDTVVPEINTPRTFSGAVPSGDLPRLDEESEDEKPPAFAVSAEGVTANQKVVPPAQITNGAPVVSARALEPATSARSRDIQSAALSVIKKSLKEEKRGGSEAGCVTAQHKSQYSREEHNSESAGQKPDIHVAARVAHDICLSEPSPPLAPRKSHTRDGSNPGAYPISGIEAQQEQHADWDPDNRRDMLVRTPSLPADIVSAYVVDATDPDEIIRHHQTQIHQLRERVEQMDRTQIQRLSAIVQGLHHRDDWIDSSDAGSGRGSYREGSSRTDESMGCSIGSKSKNEVRGVAQELKIRGGGVYHGEVIIQPLRIWRLGQSYIRHGQGTMTYKAGDKYIGGWRKDKRHGNGTYTRPDGKEYEGEWKNDLANGNGVMKFPDGSVYTGEFKNHKRHGKGTFTKKDGSCYDGDWYDDCQHGNGSFTSHDRRTYSVVFQDGRLVKKV